MWVPSSRRTRMFQRRVVSNKIPNEADELSTVIELLEQILLKGTNENRRVCKYCKAKMMVPIELHKEDCLWRRAWKFVNDRKSKTA
jgi:hypothetical protein